MEGRGASWKLFLSEGIEIEIQNNSMCESQKHCVSLSGGRTDSN